MPIIEIRKPRILSSFLRNVDPSRTTMLRRKFYNDVRKRTRKLEQDIYKLVVTEDEFGLDIKQPNIFMSLQGEKTDEEIEAVINRQRYRFLTDPQKLEAFRVWLQTQIDTGILTVERPIVSVTRPWTAEYVQSAYRKGIVRAYTDTHGLRGFPSQGFDISQQQFIASAFNSPEALSKVELLATRSFEVLKGFTSDMAAQLNRLMADGISQGLAVKTIARNMRRTITGLTRVRALRIARTELIHAHAEGQLDSFEKLGVEEVGVLAEWKTAGDQLVCPICKGYASRGPYKIKKARGLIPAHPNCRCAWVPLLKD